MSDLNRTNTEVAKKATLYTPSTSIDEGVFIGFDGDPSTILTDTTDVGEQLLNRCPAPTLYANTQSEFFKKLPDGSWEELGSGGVVDQGSGTGLVSNLVIEGSLSVGDVVELHTITKAGDYIFSLDPNMENNNFGGIFTVNNEVNRRIDDLRIATNRLIVAGAQVGDVIRLEVTDNGNSIWTDVGTGIGAPAWGNPQSVATENGNMYVTDSSLDEIWMRDANGTWTNIGADGGAPAWNTIYSIAALNGELFVADRGLKQIWTRSLGGTWSNIGSGVSWGFQSAIAVETDAMYVIDTSNKRIWMKKGIVWTIVSTGTGAPSWSDPWGMTVENGVLYVTDRGLHQVWMRSIDGVWTNIGDDPGAPTWITPWGTTIENGILYVVDSNLNQIWTRTVDGSWSIVGVGDGAPAWSNPTSISVDSGILTVADAYIDAVWSYNGRISVHAEMAFDGKLYSESDESGLISAITIVEDLTIGDVVDLHTIVKSGDYTITLDPNLAAVHENFGGLVTVNGDPKHIIQTLNNSTTGQIIVTDTQVGDIIQLEITDNNSKWTDISGAPDWREPFCIASENGILYVSDVTSNRIYMRDINGTWTEIGVGNGAPTWNSAQSMAVENGVLYVSDTTIDQTWMRDISGTWTEISGPAFTYVRGMALSNDVLYVADSNLDQIWMRDVGGVWHDISTGNGAPTWNSPMGMAADNGVLYVSDTGLDQIWMRDTSGAWTNVGGGTGAPTWYNVWGLAAENGLLYATDISLNVVMRRELDGSWTDVGKSVSAPAWATVVGIAIENGVLYVTDASLDQIWTCDMYASTHATFNLAGEVAYAGTLIAGIDDIVDPTATNDINDPLHPGIVPGQIWTNTVTGHNFICSSNDDGSAVWEKVVVESELPGIQYMSTLEAAIPAGAVLAQSVSTVTVPNVTSNVNTTFNIQGNSLDGTLTLRNSSNEAVFHTTAMPVDDALSEINVNIGVTANEPLHLEYTPDYSAASWLDLANSAGINYVRGIDVCDNIVAISAYGCFIIQHNMDSVKDNVSNLVQLPDSLSVINGFALTADSVYMPISNSSVGVGVHQRDDNSFRMLSDGISYGNIPAITNTPTWNSPSDAVKTDDYLYVCDSGSDSLFRLVLATGVWEDITGTFPGVSLDLSRLSLIGDTIYFGAVSGTLTNQIVAKNLTTDSYSYIRGLPPGCWMDTASTEDTIVVSDWKNYQVAMKNVVTDSPWIVLDMSGRETRSVTHYNGTLYSANRAAIGTIATLKLQELQLATVTGMRAPDASYVPVDQSGWGIEATVDPTASNDADDAVHTQIYPGALWTNTTTGHKFICSSNAVGSAVWERLLVESDMPASGPLRAGAYNVTNSTTVVGGDFIPWSITATNIDDFGVGSNTGQITLPAGSRYTINANFSMYNMTGGTSVVTLYDAANPSEILSLSQMIQPQLAGSGSKGHSIATIVDATAGDVVIHFTVAAGCTLQGGYTQLTIQEIPASKYTPVSQSGWGIEATVDPTANDDSSGADNIPGALWTNTTSSHKFICSSNAIGAAVWDKLVVESELPVGSPLRVGAYDVTNSTAVSGDGAIPWSTTATNLDDFGVGSNTGQITLPAGSRYTINANFSMYSMAGGTGTVNLYDVANPSVSLGSSQMIQPQLAGSGSKGHSIATIVDATAGDVVIQFVVATGCTFQGKFTQLTVQEIPASTYTPVDSIHAEPVYVNSQVSTASAGAYLLDTSTSSNNTDVQLTYTGTRTFSVIDVANNFGTVKQAATVIVGGNTWTLDKSNTEYSFYPAGSKWYVVERSIVVMVSN